MAVIRSYTTRVRRITVKGYWQNKFLLFYLKERLRLFIRACYRFFISCLSLEIFLRKTMNCPPSWIIIIPEPTARSAVPGVSPGRGLLIPHGYLHPGKKTA